MVGHSTISIFHSGPERIAIEQISLSAECEGEEKPQEEQSSVFACAHACRHVSTLFIYGKHTKKGSACNRNGCLCYCQLNVTSNDQCLNQKHAATFDLYRLKIIKEGGRIFFIVYFITAQDVI